MKITPFGTGSYSICPRWAGHPTYERPAGRGFPAGFVFPLSRSPFGRTAGLDGPHQPVFNEGKKYHGIYELESDTLRECRVNADQERPKEFKAGPGVKLFVSRRIKP
jgi:hypothetical protein